MDPLVVFLFIIILITIFTAKFHVPPFLTLTGAALLFGFLTGMGNTTVPVITEGMGKIFALLGIPIFSGAVIAMVLRNTGGIERITSDVKRVVRLPLLASGIGGYLLSLPLMCCLTSFIVISPVIEHPSFSGKHKRQLLYMAAFGSIISFVLLYPLPVAYSVVSNTGITNFDPLIYTTVAFPLSLALLVFAYLFFRRTKLPDSDKAVESEVLDKNTEIVRWKAWAPIIVPFLLIGAGFVSEPLRILGNINIALFAGAITAIIIAGDKRLYSIEKGTKNAGIIMFDLCGAGGLGYIIAAGSFASQIYDGISGIIPAVLLQFILASLIQTAQGSRVVTAVVTSTIIGKNGLIEYLPPVSLMLMIAAGTLIFSYISDPYFWLVKRTTGDDLITVLKNYSLPQACAGIFILIVALAVSGL